MKKICNAIAMLCLAASCAGGVSACGKPSDERKEPDNVPKEINFLAIGNSHTLDTTQYLQDIAKDLGIKLNLTTMVIGGCTLDYHYETAATDRLAYEYRLSSGSDWTAYEYPCKLSEKVKGGQWDYVMIQTYSKVGGFAESYGKLDAYLDILRGYVPETAKFIWNMTWAYQSDYREEGFYNYGFDQINMYEKIAKAVKTVILPRKDIVKIVASGTAVQNARSSYIGDALTHDGIHLNPFGRYIAGMTLIKTVTGVSIDNIKYIPEIMDETKKAVAIESANNAVKKPFEITRSAYQTENR